MEEIEKIQSEIGYFLTEIIPVPWEKICFYAECQKVCTSTWFAFIEKETGVICTQEFFWKRYNKYPIRERQVNITLPDLAGDLYNAYIEKFGDAKKWCTMFYTVESDGSFKINFEYEMPKGNFVQIHHAVFERFFGVPYEYIEGKYPY
ncbi:MAG: immunity protein YezG family protein [Oscillospiraceae bacterium]